jgi:TolA-binding protein
VRRRAVPLVLAFVLGLAAAFAASCTSGVKGGLPQTDADNLRSQIADVQQFVDRGQCDGIDGQLRQVRDAIDNLPASTDSKLVANLRQGVDQLQSTAISACNARTERQTQTQTQPQETVTEAIPTVTETVPSTETTPPETTPATPTQTTPAEPTATQPAPPPDQTTTPGDTSGGVGVTP